MRTQRLASRASEVVGFEVNYIFLKRIGDTAALVLINILIVALGYHFFGSDEYRHIARSPMLSAAALWIAAEGTLMFLRTRADLWDRFSWALFTARVFTSIYLLSSALNFLGLNYPQWYLDIVRNLFGTSAALIAAITIGEIIASMDDPPPWRVRRAVVTVGVIVAFIIGSVVVF